MTAERARLAEALRRERHWRRWGPYVSERAWGTVREDYSADGTAWDFLPHDHARSKAYRWGEDGIAGLCDNHQRLCLAFAFWNTHDPILKERLFGVSGQEGNHGEDVKESYYYLDNLPTHSYMKCLYKYPQRAFPYSRLVEESRRRNHLDPEFELFDTGAFDDNRYFDIFIEYAKAGHNDILARVTAINNGPETAVLHVLPTLWFRNTWRWFGQGAPCSLTSLDPAEIDCAHPSLGEYRLWMENCPRVLFTENETNTERLYQYASGGFYKDAFHEVVIAGRAGAAKSDAHGTKAAGWYVCTLAPGESRTIRMRLREAGGGSPEQDFDSSFATRIQEADEFYSFCPSSLSGDARMVQRQAFAGLLWSRQYYYYVVEQWLNGDPAGPPPPASRKNGRNAQWTHLYSEDILSMPDKWEYPWFAAWDSAFHQIPCALIDPDHAKLELSRFLREWYMHPSGQLPAYEWAFGDVNPPVHAWACWRVYKIDAKIQGKHDTAFLEAAFHKLLMNFTWWVNRKDTYGDNIFEGGFLGLDNVGVFDRSKPLPVGGFLEQSDGTSWMAMYCLNLLHIALELALTNRVYEEVASKFFEHFLFISAAMNHLDGAGLWNEEDGFYYDRLRFQDRPSITMRVRSLVGLIPMIAVDTLESHILEKLPGFRKRMEWFIHNRPDLCADLASMTRHGVEARRLLAICNADRLRRLLAHMLDETEFLSPYGVRSLSRYHRDHPYSLPIDGSTYSVGYEPAESTTGLFGGNSNWRGPVWFPTNYLLIESLQKFHHYYGADFQVEMPTGSGVHHTLGEVANEISKRLARLFVRGADGRRPVFGGNSRYQEDPHFRDYIPFFEYFHGDNGAGIGASHQTGWTSLVAKLIQQNGV